MPTELLLDYVIAISTLATSVAAVMIAWIAHRFSKERARQDHESSVRQRHREWNADVDEVIADSNPKRGAIRRNPAPDLLKAVKVDTRRINSQLATLDGHLYFLPGLNTPNDPWIDAFDEMEIQGRDLISAMLNGTLDVVKDSVLHQSLDTDDDLSYIDDDFWTEPYFSEQATASVADIFREDSQLNTRVEDAVKRWTSPSTPDSAQVRIAELVRYKLQLELSLRTFFVGTFTNRTHGSESAPSLRYRDGMKFTTSKLRDGIDESIDALASAIK